MTDEELQQHKLTLDQQLEKGIALLQDAHRTQMRALELIRMASRNEPAAATVSAPVSEEPALKPEPAPQPKRRAPGELCDEVAAVIERLPETFDKNDVCRALGYSPDRVALFRVLRNLEYEGHIEVQKYGGGRRTTVYRRRESSGAIPEGG